MKMKIYSGPLNIKKPEKNSYYSWSSSLPIFRTNSLKIGAKGF
jgi:hypothetical protein